MTLTYRLARGQQLTVGAHIDATTDWGNRVPVRVHEITCGSTVVWGRDTVSGRIVPVGLEVSR